MHARRRARPGRRAADVRQRHPRPARRSSARIGERWASWKDDERGWIVKLEFTADTIDHDARWGFEPRKQPLHPLNAEAIHALAAGRAARAASSPGCAPSRAEADESRFDSGAFTFDETDHGDFDTAPHLEPLPYARTTPATSSPAAARAAIKRADEPTPSLSETADLLEALRRRRGEREAAVVAEPEQPQLPLVPAPVAETPQPAPEAKKSPEEKPGTAARALWGGKTATGPASSSRGSKKGRASMPSWDEIVFGARTDDDLA